MPEPDPYTERRQAEAREGRARRGTHVRIPDDLLARLDKVADERVVGRNLLILKAIESFLDRLPPLER